MEKQSLEQAADRLLPGYLVPEVRSKLTELAFESLDERTIQDTLADAATIITDSHAPLGGFFGRGYGGMLVTIWHRHSLLGWRAKQNAKEGNLPAALFAASLYDFDRNGMLADIAEKAAEEQELTIGKLAIDAMYTNDGMVDEDRDRALNAYNKAFFKQLPLF